MAKRHISKEGPSAGTALSGVVSGVEVSQSITMIAEMSSPSHASGIVYEISPWGLGSWIVSTKILE